MSSSSGGFRAGRRSRGRRRLSTVAVVVLSLLTGVGPANAAEWKPRNPKVWSPRDLEPVAAVGGKNAAAVKPTPPKGDGTPAWKSKAVSWPAAVDSEVDLAPKTATPNSVRESAFAAAPAAVPAGGRAGAAPVWVSSPAVAAVAEAPGMLGARSAPAPQKVRVTVADRSAAEKAGVNGLLLSVRPSASGGGAGAPVKVDVDVSSVEGAFGGDWLSRARLVALPECALTTPEQPECRTQTPVETRRAQARPGLLSTDVELRPGAAQAAPAAADLGARSLAAAPSGAMVLAASAAPGGGAGTFAATGLAPSGTWTVGGSTGGFNWSYPIAVPDGLGGSKPNVSLSYSSQAVDGRTAATNNQSSWIGEGWDYTPGFVERRFKPCAKDGQAGSGEQCLSGWNATISLNGRSSTLVRDDGTGAWRLEGDDASRVELLTGATNGDNNGEHWRVTTTDGTQYYFGAGRKPGAGAGSPATNSAWTTPVYGNNAGEECNKSTFDTSWCDQAWRWNLDFVVDPRGGVVSHWYEKETNYYQRGVSAQNPSGTRTSYVRGGYLTRIAYGSRLTDADSVKPTGQVLFGTVERCLPDDAFDCAPGKLNAANAAKWPDVPFDQNCGASGTCTNYSATFWSTKRLAKITTQVLNGGGYADVDSYALDQEYPDPGDRTAPALWLKSLTHTGYDGANRIQQPAITFTGQFLNNRVDSSTDGRPALNRRRIIGVTAETGKVTEAVYAGTDCAPGALPGSQDGNGKRCYPVYWNADEKSPLDPTLDWFHKYVVSQVNERDPFGGSPARTTTYQYLGDAAWHRDDDEYTDPKRRTWNQFRGYEQVVTRSGAAPDPIGKAVAFYLRGMDGDYKADGSKRSVTYTDINGATVKDANPLAGSLRERHTYTADGGTVVAITKSDMWLSNSTATHNRGTGLPPLTAQMMRNGTGKDTALRSDGGWQSTSKTAVFDEYGMPKRVVDRADGLPDLCVVTKYARNTAAWMVDRVAETIQGQGDCATDPTEANTLGRNRAFFDGQAFNVLTGPGQVTRTEELDGFSGGQPVFSLVSTVGYDSYGRVTTSTDAAGATTGTEYQPASGALPTTVKVTNAKGWSSTTAFHPTREVPVSSTDHNGRTSQQTVDALGRTTASWQPGRTPGKDLADTVVEYQLTNTGTSSVTTKQLRESGESYTVGVTILNAFGEPVQNQSSPANAAADARVVSDTFYDSHGQVVKTNQPYINRTGNPGTTRFVANDNEVPGQNAAFYDGLGRPVVRTFSSKAIEQWRSTVSYPGVDRTDATPPQGGVATSTLVDSRGRTTELRQYRNGAPQGAYDATKYTYDVEGKLSQVNDPVGNAWKYGYDIHGRQTRAEDPDKGTTTTVYDAADRPVSTTDARGITVAVSYDILGRPLSRNLDSTTGTPLATYEYDTLLPGLPTAATSWSDGKGYRQEVTGYNTAYQATSTRITVPDGEGALTGTYSNETTYDPISGLPVLTDLGATGPLPAETVYLGRNPNGLLISMGSSLGDDFVNFTVHDELGRLERITYGDVPKQVAVTHTYDPGTGRLLRSLLDKEDGRTSVDITDYTYSPAGDVTSVSSWRNDGATDTQCFTYDHLKRLTQAWTDTGGTSTRPGPSVPGIGGCANTNPDPAAIGGPNPYWQSFGYDATGNRTGTVDHDPTGNTANDVTSTHTYPAPGQPRPHAPTSTRTTTGDGPTVTTGYTYDQTGNTLTRPDGGGNTQTMTWDPDGHLATAATAGGDSSYVYDADGNRLLRRDPGRTTLYLGSTELTLDTASGEVTGTRYYPTAGGPTIARTSDGRLSYIASDLNGTGTTAIDTSSLGVTRRAFKPFGEERGAQPAPGEWLGEKGFVGGTQDKATGLTHLGAREYDPKLGRFLSVDPVIDTSDPQQLQGYLYANNSPLTFSDPSGLWWGSSIVKKATQAVSKAVDVVKENYSTISNIGHTVLDVAGMVPVIGDACDIVNGVWYAAEGDWKNAAMSLVAVVPVIGSAATAARIASKAANIVDAATDVAKAVERGSEAAKSVRSASKSVPSSPRAATAGGKAGPTPGAGKAGGGKSTGGGGGKASGGGAKSSGGSSNAGGRAAPGCKNSFTPETMVLMADGTTKPIERITTGDHVLAADPTTGRITAEEVTATVIGDGDKNLYEITVDPATTTQTPGITHPTDDAVKSAANFTVDVTKSQTVTATDNHPFWLPRTKEWLTADKLQPGQWLETSAGTWVQISSIRSYTQQQRVHNLTVSDLHTYYVLAGTTPVLVHNCGETDVTTVYRKQDTSIPETQRLSVDEGGNVSHSGSGSLYLNMTGDISHSLGFKGDQLVAFHVPTSFVRQLSEASLPQRMPRGWAGTRREWNQALKMAPDQSDGPGLFGLRDHHIPGLMEAIIPGSGRIIG
ncbi:RHS repeat-associated core domain-containing protein [Kitasatospora purpeofusca]|uniref:RHS repeat-associated core domain-containing protein n=1 Tax=Kitasatospora purpeofusca TaxID=67352 RepID=UPI0022598BF1|nr:RHS repeat-associated core domain-containing protein [Kitasatospora purpeofusca]MCX4756998.1 polymorphic toxin-type HINT domain-containing protein [Kitasatospora purpeofusca]WSR35235.1 polymorphic toxin-type HINT domain-containing protein [Kitasatospora purpeofusca]